MKKVKVEAIGDIWGKNSIYRWEFLRRDKGYRRDYDKSLSFADVARKYHLQHPLDPELSVLDKNYEYNDYLYTFLFSDNPFVIRTLDEGNLGNGIDVTDDEILPAAFPRYIREKKASQKEIKAHLLLVAVPLEEPLKNLVEDFELLISGAQKKYFELLGVPLPECRGNPRWEMFKYYLRVFDLKGERKTNRQIAEIAPEIFSGKNIDLNSFNSLHWADRNIDDYYRKAKKLIANAVKGIFPGKYY